MKAKVDPDICIGCGLCFVTCPEVFRMVGAKGDKALACVEVVPRQAEEACRKAADDCPVAAISISGVQ